ncbi:MAG: hypothetical protein ACP5LD_10500 [Desulfomonilaceae bacterium]
MEKEKVREWVKSAEADGWKTYHGLSGLLGMEEAVRGAKVVDGLGEFNFVAIIGENSEVGMWGPDGLQTVVPFPYRSPGADLLETCPVCGATGVKTYQYSFAGRACAKCLPEMKRKYESPGWYN